MDTISRWLASDSYPTFPRLDRDIRVDVVIVGGGVMGISAAYMLKKAGVKVALLERGRLGHSETGHTTAHLTYVTDTRLSGLIAKFGRDHAQAVWDAGNAALHFIGRTVCEEQLACEYLQVPGYLHLPRGVHVDRQEIERLRNEAEVARELGFDATFLESVCLVDRPGIRFDHQAEFHLLKYIHGLAAKIPGDGSYIFEDSEIREFRDDPLQVHANGAAVTCRYIIVATHVPLLGNNGLMSGAAFQSKLTGYSSYVIGASIPKGVAAPACFWDTHNPYDYVRIDPQSARDYVIYGGEDHKTGQVESTEQCYARLQQRLLSLLPEAKIDRKWSGQIIESNDGLPFIGEIIPRQFVATAFGGNGITFSTIAAMMACDAVLKRKNPWTDLFDPHRKKMLGGTWDYFKENKDYPYYLLKDRFHGAEGGDPAALHPGDGKVLKVNGKKAACYRDEDGKLHAVSAVCTHMGCLVHFNSAERTWDCPCHGSRFTPDGKVTAGPAEEPLRQVYIPIRADKA